jgi:cell division protein FtsI/penicillin-binding protein 2
MSMDVRLTVDIDLQEIVEQELENGLAEFGAESGAVVLMEPATGDILAMAGRPHFNLVTRAELPSGSLNPAVQSVYEPGSLFQAVTIAAALDQGVIDTDTTVDCRHGRFQEGAVQINDDFPSDIIPASAVLEQNSNIGTYLIARKLGRERLMDSIHAFGFGSRTGIALPGEASGSIVAGDNKVDFSRITFGYGISTTPVQLAAAYCVIANDGQLMQPRLVEAVLGSGGAVEKSFAPQVVRRVLQPATARQMRATLAGVCAAEGNGRLPGIEGLPVAGKAGTSRKFDTSTHTYATGRYVVSFAGMFPAGHPAFVCVVLLDDPQTTKVPRAGARIAAPVFSKIAGRAMRVLKGDRRSVHQPRPSL